MEHANSKRREGWGVGELAGSPSVPEDFESGYNDEKYVFLFIYLFIIIFI